MVDEQLVADFDPRFAQQEARFGVQRKALSKLPIVDISAFVQGGSLDERQKVARALRETCIDIGFFYLTGHGIPQAEFDEAARWTHRFFEQPMSEKMKVHSGKSPTRQGYVGMGGMNPDAATKSVTDIKERYYISREILPGEPEVGRGAAGTSQWPEGLDGFAAFMKAHVQKRIDVAHHMAHAFALSLELPETYFDDVFRFMSVTFVLNYYPAIAERESNAQWSFSPHTDYGAFTLLSQDELGGLQVKNAAGAWIDVPPVPGTFVVNLGDLLATWTNDLYASTLHRALNASTTKPRVAIPLFVAPHPTSTVRCLETCQSAENPPRYQAVNAGEYIKTLVDEAYRTGRPALAAKTLQRFRTH